MEELIPIISNMDIKRSPNVAWRKETILIKYENIIKGVDKHIVEILDKPTIKPLIEDLQIDYSKVNPDNYNLLCKTSVNILKWLSNREEDDYFFVERLNQIKDVYMDFYLKCDPLPLVYDLNQLLSQKSMVEEIIIWHPRLDYRVNIDIEDLFDSEKITVTSQPLEELLSERTDITSFFTDDIEDISILALTGNIKYMEIMIGTFLHNYDDKGNFLLDIEDFMSSNLCKIATFVPYNIRKEDQENE